MKFRSCGSVLLLALALFPFGPALSAQSSDIPSQNTASFTAATSTVEVPRLIKFSGTLLNERGHAVAGPVGVTFALYAQQTGGATLWLETQNVKPDANGDYIVLLGANSAKVVPAELFTSGEGELAFLHAVAAPALLVSPVMDCARRGAMQQAQTPPAELLWLSGAARSREEEASAELA